MARLAVRIEARTERGTREGVLPLVRVCARHGAPALFLFALGPDRMGRLAWRQWLGGRLVRRKAGAGPPPAGTGGWINGVLRPGPHLGRRHGSLLRQVRDQGFDVGLLAYDAHRWLTRLPRLPIEQIRGDFNRAAAEFRRIFGGKPRLAGVPDWQCNARILQVYDEAALLLASDTRGRAPFVPVIGGREFRTPQFPTTLPTLGEMMARAELPDTRLLEFFVERIAAGGDQVLTVQAEVEGLAHPGFFERVLTESLARGVTFWSLREEAERHARRGLMDLPRDGIELQPVPGREGRVAIQASAVMARSEADLKSRPPWARRS